MQSESSLHFLSTNSTFERNDPASALFFFTMRSVNSILLSPAVKYFFAFTFLLPAFAGTAQVKYRVEYTDSNSNHLSVSIAFSDSSIKFPELVFPRSVPGAYSIYFFDRYVTDVMAETGTGVQRPMIKDENDAPRWHLADTSVAIHSISYRVDINRMEKELNTSNSSVLRRDFAGMLNYSVLGWVSGMDRRPVVCSVKTFQHWPVFSTNDPGLKSVNGELVFREKDYYALADGQLYLGPAFQVRKTDDQVPLYIVSYCETGKEFLDDYVRQGKESLGILNDYFGSLPFTHYSILLLKALPLTNRVAPQLAMEHLASATFFGDTSGVRNGPVAETVYMRSLSAILHHMAHAYIPLRCYGDTYRPHVMEIPPVISNIWFNEGFMWFLVFDTLKLARMPERFRKNIFETDGQIKKMDLFYLSQTASTLYGEDFRLGQAVYSRGGMMAIEMDKMLKERTGGKKSMRSVLRYLYDWSKKQNRSFTMEEFPLLINQAAGMDLSPVYNKWRQPIP